MKTKKRQASAKEIMWFLFVLILIASSFALGWELNNQRVCNLLRAHLTGHTAGPCLKYNPKVSILEQTLEQQLLEGAKEETKKPE